MKSRLIVVVALAITAIGLVTCKDSPTGVSPSSDDLALQTSQGQAGAAKIKSVSVAPSSASIQAGGSLQLTATSKPSQATTFAWASSNTSVATVTQTGLVNGVAAGSATVTASAGGKSGSSIITVTAGTPPGSEVIVGAGDISDCNNNNDEATAKLLDVTPGTVVLMGDNVYENGTTTEYNNCYNPTWGRHKSRTKPSPGNHEYNTVNATGYYGYFGSAAGDPTKGYYSYDLGDWHVVVLNSNIARDALSPQIAWLRADLTANTKSCTLAYWHHPRYSSGSEHGNDVSMQPYWDVLYEFNADVILNGHDHDYERFAPQSAAGAADNARGIREFVVGTGGRALYTLGVRKANSEVFNSTTFGVLKMTLSPGSYSWQFIPIAGQSFNDSGASACH